MSGGPFGLTEFGSRGPVLLPGAVYSPTGARTLYVHHNASSAYSDLPNEVTNALYTSIHKALKGVEDDRGDVIQLLPGHAENIDSATYLTQTDATLPRGWTVRGPDTGKPAVLTWSVAGAIWNMSAADCAIDGGRSDGTYGIVLECAGPSGTTALSVAAPLKLTAARCKIARCKMRISIDADQLATIAVTTDANADDCAIVGNHIFGATAGEVTTAIDIIGADRLLLAGNYIAGATSAVGVGIVRFATTPSLDIRSGGNVFINRKAASTAAVTGLAAVSGASQHDHFAYLDTASLTPWLTSTGIMTFHRPTVTNTAGETGTEVVGTVSA